MKKEKNNLIEKSPYLKQIEKQENRGIVKIGFDEEKALLPNIKEAKKSRHKPQESEIQKKKTAKREKKQKKAEKHFFVEDNIIADKEIKKLPVLKGETEKILAKAENKMYATHTTNTEKVLISAEGKEKSGMSETGIKIEDLEKEIREKKKLLKIKREEEKRKLEEEVKRQEEERRKEEEKKKLEETEVPQEIKSEIQEIKIIPKNNRFIKICPLCNSPIDKSKVIQRGLNLTQFFTCKNKMCNFKKEIALEI